MNSMIEKIEKFLSTFPEERPERKTIAMNSKDFEALKIHVKENVANINMVSDPTIFGMDIVPLDYIERGKFLIPMTKEEKEDLERLKSLNQKTKQQ